MKTNLKIERSSSASYSPVGSKKRNIVFQSNTQKRIGRPLIQNVLTASKGNSFIVSMMIDPGNEITSIVLKYGVSELNLVTTLPVVVNTLQRVYFSINDIDPSAFFYFIIEAQNSRGSDIFRGTVGMKPFIKMTVDATDQLIRFDLAGDSGQLLIVKIEGDGTREIEMTGALQSVSIETSFPGLFDIEITGDLDDLFSLSIMGKTNIKDLRVSQLSGLEDLICNNAGLSIESIDAILFNIANIEAFPNLYIPFNIGFHGQTPPAPPTLSILNRFIEMRGLTGFSDVDPQPYTFKVVCPFPNTTPNKTAGFVFDPIGSGKELTIDWGDGQQESFLSNENWNRIEPTHVYNIPGTYLIRISGDVESFYNIGPYYGLESKVTEFNPKNLLGLASLSFSGSKLLKPVIIECLNQLYVASKYPLLTYVDFAGQIPEVFLTQQEYEYYTNLRPEVSITMLVQ